MKAAPRRIVLALIATLVLTGGCSSSGGSSPEKTPRPEENEKASPLGVDKPDPDRLIQNALKAADLGELDTWLSHFAYRGDGEAIFAGSVEKLGIDPADGTKRMREWAATFKVLMDPSMVAVRYGTPKNVRNSPPTVDVPTARSNRYATLSDEERQRVVAAVNRLRPEDRPIGWREVEAQLIGAPPNGEMRFVYVEGAWRFDATGPR